MPNVTSESADRSAAFLAELAGLVRLAAGRPRLQLVAGQPGCGWSFNWRSERVTVDPDDIRQLAPDLCRGLALHEAAHAAITVVQQFVQAQVLQRLLPLINAIEDLRIENWMQRHFPGATLWIRAYNEVFSSLADSHQLPPSRQAQFLQALLDRWWLGSLRPGTLPEVMRALQEVREPLAEAIACLPPPAADASKILASQQAMWAIVGRQIVPVWERLVAADSAAGIPRLAACQEERTGSESPPSEPRSRTGCDASAADCDAAHRRPTVTTTTASPRSAAADRRQLRKRLTAALGPGGDDCYQAARRKVATLIDRVGDEPRIGQRRGLELHAGPPNRKAVRSMNSKGPSSVDRLPAEAPDSAPVVAQSAADAVATRRRLIGAAGLAGVVEVSGPIGQLLPSISPGYGFTAIIVAFVGRLHPVGVFFAGLLMALSYLGGENAQINLNLPLAVTGVFQGLLLFLLLACDVLIHYRIRIGSRKQ